MAALHALALQVFFLSVMTGLECSPSWYNKVVLKPDLHFALPDVLLTVGFL